MTKDYAKVIPQAPQAGHARFKLGELLTGVRQHFTLDFEFFAGHQIELAEGAAEHGLDVLFDIAGGAVGGQFREFGANFVEKAGSSHERYQVPVMNGRKSSTGLLSDCTRIRHAARQRMHQGGA